MVCLSSLLFSERLEKLFTSSDSAISGFTRPHVIGFVADLFFSTLESGFIFFRIRCRIRRMRLDGSRIRKEKVADSKISGYVWTGPKKTSNDGNSNRNVAEQKRIMSKTTAVARAL